MSNLIHSSTTPVVGRGAYVYAVSYEDGLRYVEPAFFDVRITSPEEVENYIRALKQASERVWPQS